MDAEEKQRIVEALKKANVRMPCPRCGNINFAIVEGYITQPVQADLPDINLGPGPVLPAIATICDRCGFISYHSLGSLRLLPSQSRDEQK
jgi:ribosomal protein L37E